MIGITAYGAYIPMWRLSRAVIAKEWGNAPVPGERSVANYDEDSLTMGVAAAIDCLDGMDRNVVDGLLFATTTSPYTEKQASPTVAMAADLRTDILTADYTNTLRAGTIALRAAADAVKAGTAKKMLVTAADVRIGKPRSPFEMNFGDSAAALLIGDTDVIATIEGSHSISHDITDVWRPEGGTYVMAWEDRWVVQEGYLNAMKQVGTACMEKCGLTPKDISKAVYYAPDARRHTELARTLGFDAKTQLQDPLFSTVGNTGAAHALMVLVAALEEAKPGDRIFLSSYGDGADAFILQVTDQIEKARNVRGVKGHLESKRMLPDYVSYARWRGIIEPEPVARRPEMMSPSAPGLWRERDAVLRFTGGKCKTCGTIQHPPQRVCTRCHTKDNFESIRLSDKKGKIFTFSMDYITGTPDVPMVIPVVDFEGGGRILTSMTDRDISEVQVGMPVENTFRKIFYAEGIHNYFWKVIPDRDKVGTFSLRADSII